MLEVYVYAIFPKKNFFDVCLVSECAPGIFEEDLKPFCFYFLPTAIVLCDEAINLRNKMNY